MSWFGGWNGVTAGSWWGATGSSQPQAVNPGAGSGKYKYSDDDIWLYINGLKAAHKKEFIQVAKPEPRVEKQVELYSPEVEKLILEIKVARASIRPVTQILPLIQELDNAIKTLEDEEEEVIQLFLLH